MGKALCEEVGVHAQLDGLLGGPGDLVNRVISTLVGAINIRSYSYPTEHPTSEVSRSGYGVLEVNPKP